MTSLHPDTDDLPDSSGVSDAAALDALLDSDGEVDLGDDELRPPVRPGDLVRLVLRGLGQTLITLGVVTLLFCLYELKITNIYTDHQQASLSEDLSARWREGTASPDIALGPYTAGQVPLAPYGGAEFRIYIPKIYGDGSRTVVEGVGVPDLKKGPGHLPGTQFPGALGNVVVSGHRTTYGAPFNQVDRLVAGDAIVLETKDRWYTYRVLREHVVKPTQFDVTYPVPGKFGATPTQRLLTMTTCNPKYSAKQRLVVVSQLESVLPKATTPRPPALVRGA